MLILGLSYKSFASTGNAADGLQFLLVIVGFLLILVCLLTGSDYLKNNGRAMIYSTLSFFRRMIALLKDYINKIKSDYLDLSYF